MIVSKKFYKSLTERIESSFDRATAGQLTALVADRVEGMEPDLAECSEMVKMLYTFILADIEKAITRSARCREVARRRKEEKAKAAESAKNSTKPAPDFFEKEIILGDIDENHELVMRLPAGIPRAERRRLEREARRRVRAQGYPLAPPGSIPPASQTAPNGSPNGPNSPK